MKRAVASKAVFVREMLPHNQSESLTQVHGPLLLHNQGFLSCGSDIVCNVVMQLNEFDGGTKETHEPCVATSDVTANC